MPVPRRLALAALAGLALSLAFEPVAVPWVIPAALAARLLALRGLSGRAALVPGAAFAVAFCFVHLAWMTAVGVGAWLALAAAEAAFLTVLAAIDTVLLRGRWWPWWTAVSWVAVEWARSGWPFGGMPWGRLGFAVVDTPLAPALPYVGTTGVSLILALLGGLVARLIVDRSARPGVLAASGVLLAAATVPAWHPWHGRVVGHVEVAAVQGNVPGDGHVLDNYRAITRNHVDLTRRLADEVAAGRRPRPAFVLWPENSTSLDPMTDAVTSNGVWLAVRSIGVPVVIGALPNAPDRIHVLNQGIVWDPVTGPGDRYTKHHPVPFGEYLPLRSLLGSHNFGGLQHLSYDMVAGTGHAPLRIPLASATQPAAALQVADAICFDVAYDGVLDDQVRRGARLVTVQTSNASFIDTPQIAQQFAITRAQALATGRYAVVAALNGVSGVIAPDGHVVASARTRTEAVIEKRVALLSGTTPAVWLGGAPGQVSAGLVLARLALDPIMRWRRRKDRREH